MSSFLISEILERLAEEKIEMDWYSGKRILVSGGAGFIGSWLVEALVRLGAEVYVIDNLWRGSLDNFQKDDGGSWIDLKKQFMLGDLREFHTALSSCLWAKPDIVLHLADIVAGIDFVFVNEPFIFRTNLLINTNMFTAAAEAGIKQIVYVGTACSYPQKLQEKPGGVPLVEEQISPADPESGYGWSKLMGEYEAELLGRYSKIDVGILRLHNVYGPRSSLSIKRSQVIPSLIRKAVRYPDEEFTVWGSGKQSRDFVFVGDVVDALLRLPIKGMNKGAIQIGTAQETTIAELAHAIVKESGKEIPIKFDQTKPEGDVGRSGNYEKANRILGWNVFTLLEDGLKRTYEWADDQIHNKNIRLDD
jgi:nucleoside-diphosphate-sugar epimerase